jgi:peptide/nickel transport system substrate-binding protein
VASGEAGSARAGIVTGTHIRREEGMEEFIQGLSRLELIKRGALGAAALGGADALLRAEAAAGAETAVGARAGGELVVGIGQVFEDINVLTAFGYRWGQLMAYAMYDTLVKYDNKGRAVPLLATRWQTPNPRTTIVTIRKGVTFHNGKPMRVEDVVWSLNRIHDPVKPASNNFLALPKDIWGRATKINDSQFRIVTRKPTRMIENFRFWFIMPENADSLNLGQRPIGTGPFQYKNFVKGDRLELEKYPDYWNGSRPYLEELTFRFLADEAAQVANFLSGDVQYLHDLSVATLPQVEGKRNSKLIPSGIFFQWWQPQMYKGPLEDVRVRRALMYAFDRKTDNRVAWAGKATDTWNPFQKTPYYIGQPWPGGGKPPSYDPERAKRDLAAAGQPNLKLNMMVIREPGPWKRESEVLQQGFEKAGIDATIQVLPASQWFDRLYTKRNHDGIAVNAGTLPFPWALIANYMMKASLLSDPSKGLKPPAIPVLEAAYNKAFSSANEAQYTASLKVIQRQMLLQAAVFHTMMANNQNVAPRNLMGVESTLIGDQRFDGAYFA